METVLLREVTVRLRDSSRLEMALRAHGFKNFSIHYQDGRHAILVFDTEEDALIFALKGILETLKDNSVWYCPEPEFDFMIRLEKKLKSFSKCDEFYIRQKVKDT
jgi:hypothetical protein